MLGSRVSGLGFRAYGLGFRCRLGFEAQGDRDLGYCGRTPVPGDGLTNVCPRGVQGLVDWGMGFSNQAFGVQVFVYVFGALTWSLGLEF